MSLLSRAVPPRAVKSIDQDAMSDPYYQGTYIPIESLRSWTGLGLTSEAALNYIAVYQCVRLLSNVFAMLPLKLYRRRPDGGKEDATDHHLYRVLHLQPNPEMTSFTWRKIVKRHVLTWGNHYSEVVEDLRSGETTLWPIRPDRILVSWDGGRRVYDYLSDSGVKRRMKPGSVFHLQGQTTDGLVGQSPIRELSSTLGLGRSADQYGVAVFDNQARPALVIQHPKSLTLPAQDRLKAQMDGLRGARNAGKSVLLEEGATVNPIGFPPEDAQFLETRLTQHRLIYGAYGVPPHKVGDLERATFSNIEHQGLEFIQDAMLPWLVNAEQEIAVQLVDDDDYFAEFLVDGYLRGDAKSRAEALAIRWQHGTLTPDEWRAIENDNPLPDGIGQRTYVPVNYQSVDPPGVGPAPGIEPVPELDQTFVALEQAAQRPEEAVA